MKKTSLLFAFAALFAFAESVNAQAGVGVRAGYDLDAGQAVVGGSVHFQPATLPVRIEPAVDFYLNSPSGTSRMQFDVNALYSIGGEFATTFVPYVGAGLGIRYMNPDVGNASTDLGANLIAGARFGFAQLQPFVQTRIMIGSSTPVTVHGGVLYNF